MANTSSPIITSTTSLAVYTTTYFPTTTQAMMYGYYIHSLSINSGLQYYSVEEACKAADKYIEDNITYPGFFHYGIYDTTGNYLVYADCQVTTTPSPVTTTTTKGPSMPPTTTTTGYPTTTTTHIATIMATTTTTECPKYIFQVKDINGYTILYSSLRTYSTPEQALEDGKGYASDTQLTNVYVYVYTSTDLSSYISKYYIVETTTTTSYPTTTTNHPTTTTSMIPTIEPSTTISPIGTTTEDPEGCIKHNGTNPPSKGSPRPPQQTDDEEDVTTPIPTTLSPIICDGETGLFEPTTTTNIPITTTTLDYQYLYYQTLNKYNNIKEALRDVILSY